MLFVLKKHTKWTKYSLVPDSILDFHHTVIFKIYGSESTVLFFPDLVPKENLEKWLNYLKKEFPTVAFKSVTLMKDRTMVRALQAVS